MSIKIYPKATQAKGQFAGGAILENKPVGFPHEGGEITAFSNLFYWAHAWSDEGGLIGEHPHKGFEIMSFVLAGEIEHYDSQLRGWKRLKEGDVQVIRSRSGISHAERLHAGSHIFQIWLDPDLRKTFTMPASYDDYQSNQFPVKEGEHYKEIQFTGAASPLLLDTEDIQMSKYVLTGGEVELDLSSERTHAFYLIEGNIKMDHLEVAKDDFVLVNNAAHVSIDAKAPAILFSINTPPKLAYPSYVELVSRG